jgi:hypothetical protein
MAVIPNKFSPPRGGLEDRVKALEEHIKYLEERIEFFASQLKKKEEDNPNVRKDKE